MSYSEQYSPPNHFDIPEDPHHPAKKSQTYQGDNELELPKEVLDEVKILNKTQENILCIKVCSKSILKTILAVIVLCFFLGVGIDFADERQQVFTHRQKLIKEYEKSEMIYGCERVDLGNEDLEKFCSNLKQSIETERSKKIKLFEMDAMNQMRKKVVQTLMSSSAYSVFGLCALLVLNLCIMNNILNIDPKTKRA